MTPTLTQLLVGILLVCFVVSNPVILDSVDYDKSLSMSIVYRTSIPTITKCHPNVKNCPTSLSKVVTLTLFDPVASSALSPSIDKSEDEPTGKDDIQRSWNTSPSLIYVSSLDWTTAKSASTAISMTSASSDVNTVPAKDSSVPWKDWTFPAKDSSMLPAKNCSTLPAKDCSSSPMKDSSSSTPTSETQPSLSSSSVVGSSTLTDQSPSTTKTVPTSSSSGTASSVPVPPLPTLSGSFLSILEQTSPPPSSVVSPSTSTLSSRSSSSQAVSIPSTVSNQPSAPALQTARSASPSTISPISSTLSSSSTGYIAASSTSNSIVSPVSSTLVSLRTSQGTVPPESPGPPPATGNTSTTAVSISPGLPPVSGNSSASVPSGVPPTSGSVSTTVLPPNPSTPMISLNVSTTGTSLTPDGLPVSVSSATPISLSSSQATHTSATPQTTLVPPSVPSSSASGSPLPPNNSATSAVAPGMPASFSSSGTSSKTTAISLPQGQSSSPSSPLTSGASPAAPSPGSTGSVTSAPAIATVPGVGPSGSSSIQISPVPTITFPSSGPATFTFSLPGGTPSVWTLTSGTPQSTTCPFSIVSIDTTFFRGVETLLPTLGCNPVYTSFLGPSGSTTMTLTNPLPSIFAITVVPNIGAPTPTPSTLCVPFVTSITTVVTTETLLNGPVTILGTPTLTLTPTWGCVGPAPLSLPPCPVQTISGFPLFMTSPGCELTATPTSTWNTHFTWATATDGSSSALVEWIATSTAYKTVVDGHTSILPGGGGGGGGWGWKCVGLICDPSCTIKLCFFSVCATIDLCSHPGGGCCGGGWPFPPPPPGPPSPPPNCAGSCLPDPNCTGPLCISNTPGSQMQTQTATQSSSTTSSSCSASSVSICTQSCSTWNVTNTAAPDTTITTSCGNMTCSMLDGCYATATTTTTTLSGDACSIVPFSLDSSYSAIWSSILSEASSLASGFSDTLSNSTTPSSTSSLSPAASPTPAPTTTATSTTTLSPSSSCSASSVSICTKSCSTWNITSTIGPSTVTNEQWDCSQMTCSMADGCSATATTTTTTLTSSVNLALSSVEQSWSSADAALSSSDASARSVLSSINSVDKGPTTSVAPAPGVPVGYYPPIAAPHPSSGALYCAADLTNLPDPWPERSNFFWFTANRDNAVTFCKSLKNNKITIGLDENQYGVMPQFNEEFANDTLLAPADVAMYDHSVVFSVSYDQAGCPGPNTVPINFTEISTDDCVNYALYPVGKCDPVNTGALKNMPSSYGDYNSIGGMAWGACGRWVVVSISWPLPDNFPLGNGGLPVKSVGAPVSTIEDWCGPSGQEKLCSTTLTLNTVLPSGYFK